MVLRAKLRRTTKSGHVGDSQMESEQQNHVKFKKEKRKQKVAMQGCLKALHQGDCWNCWGTNCPDHNLKDINEGKELTAALTSLSTISKPEALGRTKLEGKK